MGWIQFCIFLLALADLVPVIYSSYIYSQKNETFQSPMRLAMSISFQDQSGFLLFAIDTDKNRLLIRVRERDYNSKEILFNFNSRKFRLNVSNISSEHINQVHFLLKVVNENMYLNYNDRVVATNVFQKNWIYPDPFEGYPIPLNYENEINKTFFWMWNIGPYTGQNNKFYDSFPKPIIGCVHEFFLDYQPVEFKKYGDVSTFCTKTYNESFCEKGLCSLKPVTENILDCSFPVLNVNGYCHKDLNSRTDHGYVYKRIGWSKNTVPLKLTWKQKVTDNYCLMEIIAKNGSSILFYTNNMNDIIMLSNSLSKTIFSNVLLNKINILFITFKDPYILIKATNGEVTKTNIEDYIMDPYKINLQMSLFYNVCVEFNGKSALQYDLSQFRLMNRPCNPQEVDNHRWKFITGGVILFSIISNVFLFCILKRRRIKQTINQYEMENISLPPIPNQDHDVYDYVKI